MQDRAALVFNLVRVASHDGREIGMTEDELLNAGEFLDLLDRFGNDDTMATGGRDDAGDELDELAAAEAAARQKVPTGSRLANMPDDMVIGVALPLAPDTYLDQDRLVQFHARINSLRKKVSDQPDEPYEAAQYNDFYSLITYTLLGRGGMQQVRNVLQSLVTKGGKSGDVNADTLARARNGARDPKVDPTIQHFFRAFSTSVSHELHKRSDPAGMLIVTNDRIDFYSIYCRMKLDLRSSNKKTHHHRFLRDQYLDKLLPHSVRYDTVLFRYIMTYLGLGRTAIANQFA